MSEKDFRSINLPERLKYSSDTDRLPLEFYLEVFPLSTKVWLKLGYFSSRAFQSIAFGFAQFVANGGRLKLVTNHFLYQQDSELLFAENPESSIDADYLLRDLEWITDSLTASDEHFMGCLRLLLASSRVEIVPVKLKPNQMAHFKEGVFQDNSGNFISTSGSVNFTSSGILWNGEGLQVRPSWLSDVDAKNAKHDVDEIESIISKSHDGYMYLSQTDIEDQILKNGPDKSLKDLLNSEVALLSTADAKRAQSLQNLLERHKRQIDVRLEEVRNSPCFPFATGPYPYQVEAYEKWVGNGMSGIFAMATGTGKTITALNAVLQRFQDEDCYQFLVVVPYKVLVEQWSDEIAKFNFKPPIKISSSNARWRDDLKELKLRLTFAPKESFSIISTYDSLATEAARECLSDLGDNVILIADEAHNAGSKTTRQVLSEMSFSRKIALSATLTRRFDDEGNSFVESYFDDRPPYVFSYTMKTALEKGVLCNYVYRPHVVHLSQEEMGVYRELSNELARLYDHKGGAFRNPERAKRLLLDRSRVIHKAEAKISSFIACCNEIIRAAGSLRYTFIYVPEGDSKDGANLLEQYMNEFERHFPDTKFGHYTYQSGARDEVLEYFEQGIFDVIFSMKCLDEGVDIPRAENAIFCSSTGNPRQFIQRRGRVLRVHEDKEESRIYDLVVAPFFNDADEVTKLEQRLMLSELARVVDFASMAENYYEATSKLEDLCKMLEINIFALDQEIWELTDA